jgi:polyisoprenoid-binding protein YceI
MMLLIPVMVMAATGDIDAGKSTVIATFKEEGVSVDAPFTKFSGHIVYDASKVAASSAMIEVETASFDMGGEEYNAEVRKKAWFDSATYPKAIFQSVSIKAEGANKFTASGNLSIKGKTVVLSVPVTVQATANANAFDGSIVISRASFGIGDKAWNDVVDDKITVRFHLVSVR